MLSRKGIARLAALTCAVLLLGGQVLAAARTSVPAGSVSPNEGVAVAAPAKGSPGKGAGPDRPGAGQMIGISSYTPGDRVAEPDEEFVRDAGYPLDWYLFRSDGPIIFDLMIDRYFGPVDGDGRLLRPENIQTTGGMVDLTLRVWDVDQDYSGGDVFPEVDNVSVNGHHLGSLAGWNDQWSTVTFSVPLSVLRFPRLGADGYVIPAANTIRIDIDVMNVGVCECWAVAVDWARLVVKGIRPAVLVHGGFSSADTWNAWTQAGGFGEQVGLPVHAFSFANNHGSWIAHMVEEAGRIQEVKQRFGVDKLHIVGHSKGGLDSRGYLAFLAGGSVKSLTMMGTPNAGSPLADIIKAAGILSPLIGGVAFLFGEPALTELTVVYMNTVFNPIVGRNPNTRYYTVAGDWQGWPNGNPLIPGPDDGVVAVSSVESLPYATALGRTSHLHTDMTAGVPEWNMAWSVLRQSAVGGLSASGAPEAASLPPALALSHLAWVDPDTSTYTHSVPLEQGTSALIGMLAPAPGLTTALVDPTGSPVTPGEGGVTLITEDDGGFLGLSGHLYLIESPMVGQYSLTVSGPSPTPHMLVAGSIGSPVQLAAGVRQPMVSVGGQAIIEGTFSAPAGTPAPAELTAHIEGPDGIETALLLDDGQGHDLLAGDGIYTGQYLPTQAGYYPAVVVAETPVRRIAPTGFLAVGGLDQIVALTDHDGVDSNGDGLFDELRAEVTLSAEQAGDFLAAWRLEDGSGQTLVQTGGLMALPQGASSRVVAFDGQPLGESGFSGDLYLHGTLLRSDGTIADVKAPLGVLSGYDSTQFAQAPIRLLPGIADGGVDADGNGKYDALRLSIPVDAVPGWYAVNARLVDGDLAEIGWTGGTVYLPGGPVTLLLDFPGLAIGQHAVDGPYYVRDFSLYSGAHSLNRVDLHTTQPYLYAQFEGAPAAVEDGLHFRPPLDGTSPVTLPADQEIPIRFQWVQNGQPTLDQQVTIRVRDGNNRLVAGFTYGYGISYDPAAGEYLQPFAPAQFGLQAGGQVQIQVYFGGKLQGTAVVDLN